MFVGVMLAYLGMEAQPNLVPRGTSLSMEVSYYQLEFLINANIVEGVNSVEYRLE